MKFSVSGLVLAFCISLTPFLVAQTPASRYDPEATHQPSQQRKSFFDFAFTQINSKDTDYGQCIEDARRIAIESSLENDYFWLSIVALSFASWFFLWIIQLRQRHRHMEACYVQVLAKMQHQIDTGAAAYDDLRKKYAGSIAQFEQLKEPKLTSKPAPPKTRIVSDTNGMNGPGKASAVAVIATGTEPLNPSNDHKDETIASLRQQLTRVTRDLEQERQRSRKLRGE